MTFREHSRNQSSTLGCRRGRGRVDELFPRVEVTCGRSRKLMEGQVVNEPDVSELVPTFRVVPRAITRPVSFDSVSHSPYHPTLESLHEIG